MTEEAASTVVRTTAGLDVVPADRNLVLDAVTLAGREELSIFDAAIVCAAQRAQCDQILTEDAKFGQAAGSIRVVDPFAA